MIKEKSHIVVTGGAQGIGRVMVEQLIGSGCCVSAFDIDSEAIEELRPLFQHQSVSFHITDVANESSVISSIQAATRQFGPAYGLINNAVYELFKPMEEITLDEWNRALNTNLTGTFLCSKYLIPSLRKMKGVIINICSTRAFQSEPHTESYSASKGGIYSLTHSMALSLGPDIRVNSISPGWIDVSSLKKRSLAKQIKISDEDRLQHPVGRVGNAMDIANMALFLMDPDNSFITGQNFIVDGGMTKKMIYV